jgi:DNA-binding SARP family transcriptional activator
MEGIRVTDSAIRLQLLGSPELSGVVERRGRSLLTQPKSLGVLAFVALAPPPGYRRRDTVAALFWPEQDQPHARGALRRVLHLLRDALGDGAVVRRGNEDIAVAPEFLTTDVAAFDRACAAGDWEGALALYRGDLLEGFFLPGVAPEFEHWLDQERLALRKRARWAAEQLAESALEAGLVPSAAEYAARAVSLFPDDEPQLRRLLRLLAELGDGAGANRTYQSFAERIAAEYDAVPAPETQALISGIRSRTVPRARSSAKLFRQSTTAVAEQPIAGPPAPATSGPPSVTRERSGLAVWLGVGLLFAALALSALALSALGR